MDDPRIEQIREVLANHTDPFSIYGHQGRGLERIRAIVGSASPDEEVRCMNGPAKQHTLRMVAIIKALKAAAVNGQLPASVEPLPFVKIARAIVDNWPTEEAPRS